MAQTLADVLKKRAVKAEQSDRPEVKWFSLKDNNPARVVFLQELSADSPNYDSSKGSALYLVEHASPHEFKRRAECTIETEGRCFACEMSREQPKIEGGSWFQKTNMYIQLFDAKSEEVKVLSRSAPGSFFDALYDYANEENDGAITGVTFKIQKAPEKTAPWTLMPTNNKLEVPASVELVDLEAAIGRKVEYAKQKNFYIPNGVDETDDKPVTGSKVQATEETINW